MRKVREEVMDKYKENLVGLEEQLKTLKTQSQTYQAQQYEQTSQLSSNVTEANFAVKQYQADIEEFKQQVAQSLQSQPHKL